MRTRSLTALGALLLALVAVVVPPASLPASAAPAPWHWVRVVDPISIAPHAYYSIREYCPSGYTALTGGLKLPAGTPNVIRGDEYRYDDETGSSWFVSFENFSSTAVSGQTIAECVLTTDLPAITHRVAEFATGAGGFAYGTIFCPSDQVVLTGGAGWSNVNTRYLYENGPAWSGQAWTAEGRNYASGGARLAVEVYCVDPAAVPGYTRVEFPQPQLSSWERTIACPVGTRVLNGGNDTGWANGSYPDRTTWTAVSSYAESGTTWLRIWCVDAGTPTIAITASDGPDGWTTDQTYALFGLSGNDPAGYPNTFRCAVDGGAPQACPLSSGGVFGPFSPGPHSFAAVNETPDGRSSAPVTFHWTVDLAPPSVSAPRLSAVSLAEGEIARWSATDDYSGVDHHEAKYWRGRANGTTVDWTQPAAWADLASPSIRVPALAAGDTLCLSVRAVDGLGHTSPWTAPRCTSRPYDDAALTASPGWTRVTNTPYWNQTLTRTTLLDETLVGTTARSRQVGVLASVCPGCGSVQVRIGGTAIGTLSLDRPTARNQQVLLLPAFTERTGVLSLVSATSGKSIRIDGLITVRRPAAGPAG